MLRRSIKKANRCPACPGGGEEWGVVVGDRKAQLGSKVLRGGESFEGHEVQPDALIDETGHGPCQFSQREQFYGIGKACYRPDRRRCDRRDGFAEGAGEDPYDGPVADGPTEPVVPQARGEDPAPAGSQTGWFVIEKHAKQDVIVDDERPVAAHSRSGSPAAAASASRA